MMQLSSKKGQIIAYFSIFLLIMLGASIVKLFWQEKEIKVGNEIGALRNGEYKLRLQAYVDEVLMKMNVENILLEHALNGGYFEGCMKEKQYVVWDGDCEINEESIIESFSKKLLDRTVIDFEINNVESGTRLEGKGKQLAFNEQNVNLIYNSRYEFVVNFDFGIYEEIKSEVEKRADCLSEMQENLLFEDTESVKKKCNFPEEWEVKLENGYLFVDVAAGVNTYGEQIVVKGAIPIS